MRRPTLETRLSISPHFASAVVVTLIASIAIAAGAPDRGATRPSNDDATIGIGAIGGGFGHGSGGDAVVPAADPATTTANALHALADPKISGQAKRQWAALVPPGLKTVLPTLHDPIRLDADAGRVLQYGVEPDATRLEYLGSNPTIETRLRPVAQAVYDMYDKVGRDAKSQAAILAPQINVRNQNTIGARWDKLDMLATSGPFERDMSAYFLALSLPRPERAAVSQRAIASLAQFDTPDSDIMPIVHLMIGRLNMVAGKYDEAGRYLDEIAAPDKRIKPAPTITQQYDARYFATIMELKKANLPGARLRFEAMLLWQQDARKTDKEDEETVRGIASANQMLRCRIFRLEAATATDQDTKNRATAAAAGIIQKLKADRPDLGEIVFGTE